MEAPLSGILETLLLVLSSYGFLSLGVFVLFVTNNQMSLRDEAAEI